MKTEDEYLKESDFIIWQLCPKCGGEGTIPPGMATINSSAICDVCHGQKIISRVTGQPPQQITYQDTDKGQYP